MNNFIKPNKLISINKMMRMRKKEIFDLIKDKQVKHMVKHNGINYYTKEVLCDILNFELNI